MQVEAFALVLNKQPRVVIATTASGKTATFFTPLVVLRHLSKNPQPKIRLQYPKKPVVIVIMPLIELGNLHVSSSVQTSPFALANG